MKKKVILMSAAALVAANALSFGPVSYKIHNTAYAASGPVEASPEIIETAKVLQGVYAEIKKDEAVKGLKNYFTAGHTQAVSDLKSNGFINFTEQAPYLKASLTEKGIDPADIEKISQDLLLELVENNFGLNSNLDDITAEAETLLQALNDKLNEGSVSIPAIQKQDVAELLLKAQETAIENLDQLTGVNVGFDSLFDAAVAILEEEWATSENTLVGAAKLLYNDSFTALEEDATKAKAHFEEVLSADAKLNYKKGAAALGIGYLKYKVSNKADVFDIVDSTTIRGKYVISSTDTRVGDLLAASNLTGMIDWKSTRGTVSFNASKELVITTSNTSNVVATITGTLAEANNVPEWLQGVTVVGVDVELPKNSSGTTDGGGFVEEGAPLQLVSDAQAKADAISGKVASYLEDYADLRNNSERFGLKAVIENGLREALLVQAAGSVSSSGVFSPTIAQMENIYNSQLTPVLNAAKAALTENGIELDIEPVLTFNIGIVTNGQVNLSKALIDSLISKGVASVGVKTGDTVIEVPLAQLSGAATINVKKTEDVYSISVVDASGNELSAFEKQYRVTLPVSGNVDEAAVTVAKLDSGSVTHIGGAYYSDTDTITFYANQLGEYSVVENSPTFNDIANLDWANTHIQLLANQGILLGTADGVFDPKATVTRAQFTTMIVRAFNLSLDGEGVSFNDVSESAWYHGAVEAAVAYGIVNGRSATTFDPNAQITRDEMATMAANALREILGYVPAQNATDVLAGFVDGNSVVPAHTAGVALLADEEIVNGRPDGSFDPKGNASRAEAAVIILNALSQRN